VGSLHEFGRYVNDLEYRARHTVGAEARARLLLDWLKDIGYEKHLYDGEDSEKLAAARWTNVLDFCDWMARAAAARSTTRPGVTIASERRACWRWRRPSALLSTLAEREQDQDVVTLSTLHASKGLEWPHVMLVGVNEGMLPFKLDDDDGRRQKPTAR
jgi:ATP-dependent DNA helicase Rep